MSDAVYQMFRRVAARYDLANDVLSLGLHRLWRGIAVRQGGVAPGWRVLDLCSGTGDFSREIWGAVGANGEVIAADFVMEMLSRAKAKRGLSTTPQVRADAMRLPFQDSSFDAVTVGFGIRNVDEPVSALCEINRILRPGGHVIVLEFGRPTLPGFAGLYRFYSKFVMPTVGGFLTGSRQAYEYLPETAARFPDGPEFVELLQRARFQCAVVRPLMSGLAYIYVGQPEASIERSRVPTSFLAHP